MDTVKRKVTVVFDCEHLKDSHILGAITEDHLRCGIEEFFKLYFVDVGMVPEEGDFYTISNPVVSVGGVD